MDLLTHELLSRCDASTTNALIAAFAADPVFAAFAAKETSQILQRDTQDAEKLTQGIAMAVSQSVLPANPPVEPIVQIDVAGQSIDDVVGMISEQLGSASSDGCVLVLSGLSGTGKGTTVSRLQEILPRSVTWSNGNIFRSLTYLALEHCEAVGGERARHQGFA